jgi:hypothetical protein
MNIYSPYIFYIGGIINTQFRNKQKGAIKMDIDQGSQAIKEFIAANGLNDDGTDQTFNSVSLNELQDQCVRLAKGIKEWANHLELRIASIEYRLDRLEKKDGHQKD